MRKPLADCNGDAAEQGQGKAPFHVGNCAQHLGFTWNPQVGIPPGRLPLEVTAERLASLSIRKTDPIIGGTPKGPLPAVPKRNQCCSPNGIWVPQAHLRAESPVKKHSPGTRSSSRNSDLQQHLKRNISEHFLHSHDHISPVLSLVGFPIPWCPRLAWSPSPTHRPTCHTLSLPHDLRSAGRWPFW